ncbi:MAG: FlgD immunoglobulin-like domain containing protein [Candidatus Krumholzibacteriota bacterium]
MRKYSFFLALVIAVIAGFSTDHFRIAQAGDQIPATTFSTIVDTLDLYGGPGTLEGTFQTAGGLPDKQGWTTSDGTSSIHDTWNISPYNAANLDPGVTDNNAWWCGQEFPACHNDTIGGYGNNWNTSLAWEGIVTDPSLPATVTVTGILNNDTEPGYDKTSLNFGTAYGQYYQTMVLDGKVVGFALFESFTYNPGEYFGDLGEVMVRLTFQSDGGWSDEDCYHPTTGAVQVDNLQVTISQTGYPDLVSPVETCEPGDPVQWEIIPNQGYGNFAQLWTGLQDADPLVDNFSPQWAFIDDGIIEPGTGGTQCRLGIGCYGPDSLVVDIWSGLQNNINIGLKNHVTSPPIELPVPTGLPGPPGLVVEELILSTDAYFHCDPACGAFMALGFDILSTADPAGQEDYIVAPQMFFVYDGPEYKRVTRVFPLDSLVPGARFVKIRISADDVRTSWCWTALFSTPAPYFDNVRLQVGLTNPASPVPEIQDGFHLSLHPNPFNPAVEISWFLPRDGELEILVYDVSGRLVRSLVGETAIAGPGSIMWRGDDEQGRSVPAGVYFCKVKSAGEILVQKMTLLK